MNKNGIKRMAVMAMLMALIVVLQFVSGMIPPIGGFTISLVLIPIVIGAAVYGIRAGAILGATFGIIVLINCITGADVGGHMVFQASPMLCALVVVGKGMLAGVASGWVYRTLKNKNAYIAMLLAAIVCPIVNTGTFLACMAVFFIDVLSAWAGGGDVLGYVLSGIVLVNFLPELIINIVFGMAGQGVIKAIEKK